MFYVNVFDTCNNEIVFAEHNMLHYFLFFSFRRQNTKGSNVEIKLSQPLMTKHTIRSICDSSVFEI